MKKVPASEYMKYNKYIEDEINLPIKHESKPYLMIPLPDGATNGDIIRALFPKIGDNFSNVIDLKLWWNAKYKVESEE